MAPILLINGSPHPNGCTATALEEMTKVLRLPRSTVNYRLKKAKAILKKELEDWYFEDE